MMVVYCACGGEDMDSFDWLERWGIDVSEQRYEQEKLRGSNIDRFFNKLGA